MACVTPPATHLPHPAWGVRTSGLRKIGLCLAFLWLAPGLLQAQAQPEIVGRIEGDDIAVKGAVGVEVESGRSTTVLGSGSEVTVRSGQARLALIEGGEMGLCAPAHFSLLKSGGAITLALDYGRVHARLERGVSLTIYTPLIVATPIAIGDGPRDATVGLEAAGAMCVRAERGAVRIEQQLTAQSLLVPQTGEVAFAGGQLESLGGIPGACQCEVLTARVAPPPRPKPPELSVPVHASLGRPSKPPGKSEVKEEEATPPAMEEPIYKVIMPPLTFDAAAPAPPPEPDPETMLLVREVRVRPTAVFTGRVAGPPVSPASPAGPAAAHPARRSAAAEDAPKKKAGFFTQVGRFFHRMFSREPCAGVGCGTR